MNHQAPFYVWAAGMYTPKIFARPHIFYRGMLCISADYGAITRYVRLSVRPFVTLVGAVVQLVEYRTRNQELAGSTHTRSTARNLEQVANLLRAQANSASYPQRDGK